MRKPVVYMSFCWALAMLGAATISHALDFPQRPIRMIVPFVAGGSSDIVARIIGQRLAEKWSQQVVVDNRPGGGTIIGTELAAKSAPDGYTLVTANVAFAINEALPRKLPYRALKDFVPVLLIARQPTVLAAFPSFPARTVPQLIERAKGNGAAIAYGSSGVGTIGHLAGELLKQMAAIPMTHVPYKGGGQLVTEVIGNQVPLGFMGLPPAIGHIKAGRLKVLGVTDGKRAASLPDAPTIGESVPGFEVNNWIGILTVAGTPAPVVKKLYEDASAVVKMEQTTRSLTEQGFEIWDGSPDEFHKLIESDIQKYTGVVKTAKIGVQ
jgi:tripartite-type tricarboxylate transporter receptor subunit TctC